MPGFSNLHMFFPKNMNNSFQDWMEMGKGAGQGWAAQKGYSRFHLHSTTLKKKKKENQAAAAYKEHVEG